MANNQDIADRIRENTKADINRRIDRQIEANIRYYSLKSKEDITSRIEELEEEIDIERALQIKVSCVASGGFLMGIISSKKWWFFTTAAIAGFWGQQALQGWSWPAACLRKMGYRTRPEIDREKFALKALRGDFDNYVKTEDKDMEKKVRAAMEAVKTA